MSKGKATAEDLPLPPVHSEAQTLGLRLAKIRDHRIGVLWHTLDGSNKTLFLLHGAGGRAGQYRQQAKVFCDRMNVVAFDFLGHGISEKVESAELYSAIEHFETLKAVYQKYKTAVNYIGAHCYGSIHVLHLLAWLKQQKRLHEVKKVIFISSGADPPSIPSLALKMPNFLLEWLRPLARDSSNAQIFSPKAPADLIQHENAITSRNPMSMMKQIGQDILAGAWIHGIEAGASVFNPTKGRVSYLPEVLVIHGKLDKTVTPESMRKMVAGMLSRATYRVCEIEDAGHLVMLEASKQFNAILATFLYH